MVFSSEMPACAASVAASSSERLSNGTTQLSKSAGAVSAGAPARFLLMSWMTPITSSR